MGKASLRTVTDQIKFISVKIGPLHIRMQIQGCSAYCGLCALNNTVTGCGIVTTPYLPSEMDELADAVWLNNAYIQQGLLQEVEPMRHRCGDYDIVVLEQAAVKRGLLWCRKGKVITSTVHQTDIKNVPSQILELIYQSLVKKLDIVKNRFILVVDGAKKHYVSVGFLDSTMLLLDSLQKTVKVLSIREGLLYLKNIPSTQLAAVKIEKNLVVIDDDEENVAGSNSSEGNPSSCFNSTPYSLLHESDLICLEKGNKINDAVIHAIGKCLSKMEKRVYVADTNLINQLRKRKATGSNKTKLGCLALEHELVLVPIHSNNTHWSLVVIDIPGQRYLEYDSSCPYKSDIEIRQLLTTWIQRSGIDISSFSELSMEERRRVPTQGSSAVDCGLFLLCGMVAQATKAPMDFHLIDMPRVREQLMMLITTKKREILSRTNLWIGSYLF